MRAAVLHRIGDPPVAGEFDAPTAKAGEIVVEVELAALNPVDLTIAGGRFYAAIPEVPSVVGREGIARLDGGGLAYFGGCIPPFGSIAERTLIGDASFIPLPSGVPADQALACGIAGLAAFLSLDSRAGLTAGERVLILGAGGAVGQVGVTAARKLGAARVVAAARSDRSLARAAELGADATVSLADDRAGITAAIRDAFDGEGPDVVLDPVWGEPASAAIDSMAFGGRLVQLGQSAGAEATFDSAAIRGHCLKIIGHTNFASSDAERKAALDTMFSWVAEGDLQVPSETLPLEAVSAAWERQAAGPGLKLLIDPHA